MSVKINFGKHKDKLVSEIPHDYLNWLYENSTNLSDELLLAIAEELQDTHHNIALDEAYKGETWGDYE